LRQAQENFLVQHRYRLNPEIELLQIVFKFPHFLLGSVPSSLQFRRKQSLIGIDSIVSPSCQSSFVTYLFQL